MLGRPANGQYLVILFSRTGIAGSAEPKLEEVQGLHQLERMTGDFYPRRVGKRPALLCIRRRSMLRASPGRRFTVSPLDRDGIIHHTPVVDEITRLCFSMVSVLPICQSLQSLQSLP